MLRTTGGFRKNSFHGFGHGDFAVGFKDLGWVFPENCFSERTLDFGFLEDQVWFSAFDWILGLLFFRISNTTKLICAQDKKQSKNASFFYDKYGPKIS